MSSIVALVAQISFPCGRSPYELVPNSIQTQFANFLCLDPNKMCYTKIVEGSRDCIHLSLVNRTSRSVCLSEMKKIHIVRSLVMKYLAGHFWSPSALIDAVSSGANHRFFDKTFPSYSKKIEEDILQIVSLMPTSIHVTLSRTRVICEVTALEMACLNENIPLSIIAHLLEKGSNPEHFHLYDGVPTHILQTLHSVTGASEIRKQGIMALFAKKGVTLERVEAKAETLRRAAIEE